MADGPIDGQQSSETSTRNGIMALEQAYTGVQNSLKDVESTRFNLASNYMGSDGGRYGQLLRQWEDQVEVILKNLQDMIDKLNQSLAEHGKVQGSSNDSIDSAYSNSQAAFDALTG